MYLFFRRMVFVARLMLAKIQKMNIPTFFLPLFYSVSILFYAISFSRKLFLGLFQPERDVFKKKTLSLHPISARKSFRNDKERCSSG